jgi:hypothetical protein
MISIILKCIFVAIQLMSQADGGRAFTPYLITAPLAAELTLLAYLNR